MASIVSPNTLAIIEAILTGVEDYVQGKPIAIPVPSETVTIAGAKVTIPALEISITK